MTDNDASNDLLSMTLARLGLGKETLSPGAETDMDQLVSDLVNPAWSVRAAAAQALGKLGERAPIQPLVASLNDRHDAVRAAGAHVLGSLGTRAPREPLRHMLHDPSWRVRTAAVLALSQMGDRVPVDKLAELVCARSGSDGSGKSRTGGTYRAPGSRPS